MISVQVQASCTQYKLLEELTSNFGTMKKIKTFIVESFRMPYNKQARSAYELIFDVTSGPSKIIKPVQENLKHQHQQIAMSDCKMIYSVLYFAISLEVMTRIEHRLTVYGSCQ